MFKSNPQNRIAAPKQKWYLLMLDWDWKDVPQSTRWGCRRESLHLHPIAHKFVVCHKQIPPESVRQGTPRQEECREAAQLISSFEESYACNRKHRATGGQGVRHSEGLRQHRTADLSPVKRKRVRDVPPLVMRWGINIWRRLHGTHKHLLKTWSFRRARTYAVPGLSNTRQVLSADVDGKQRMEVRQNTTSILKPKTDGNDAQWEEPRHMKLKFTTKASPIVEGETRRHRLHTRAHAQDWLRCSDHEAHLRFSENTRATWIRIASKST